jgi:prolyl-tRNA synthetase
MGVMRQTQLFTKTRKEAPADEMAKNAQLLIRAGFVHKEMAGAYDLLPLGFRVVDNIKKIIREEMNALGGQEFIMTGIQSKDVWTATDRWNDDIVNIWFKSELHAGGQIGFGWSHEEPITEMIKNHISSFRDLPIYVYQFQTKLRNELRAKSGLMRGREFVMKDMYSYSTDAEQHEKFYQKTIDAYKKVFDRLGVGEDTFVTFAAGGAFTEFSHEFQTICEAGEDVIYINREKNIAINEEVLNEKTLKDLNISREELEQVKTAEVGNIFNFGTEKCEQMGLYFKNDKGETIPVHLGSYGIGVTRMIGVIAEKFSDEKGLVWPESVAPFQIHLLVLGEDESVIAQAEKLYGQLTKRNIEVLFDDRKGVSPGEKFSDADLIGIPYRVVISGKTMQQDSVEIKKRTSTDMEIVPYDEFIGRFTA